MLKSIGHTHTLTHKAECHGCTLNFTDESCNARKQAAGSTVGPVDAYEAAAGDVLTTTVVVLSSVRKTDYT